MTEIRGVGYCPHCNNRATQRLIHKQFYFERTWSAKDGSESEAPWSTFVAVCETCHQILLYDNAGDQMEEKDFHLGDLIYPESGHLHISVPRMISVIYSEASRIKSIAPNAFAVQIRRALEALCEDRNAKKGILQNRLKDLADKGEIPPVLSEASDTLRILGNIGAHGLGESVHPSQVYAIDDFFRAVIEYVYVAPGKLKDFREKLSKDNESITSKPKEE